MQRFFKKHSEIESRSLLFAVLITSAVLFGGLIEIIPIFLMDSSSTVARIAAVTPYSPLELAGRDIYIREGCSYCHTQMIRSLKWETDRFDPTHAYGDEPYSKGGEYVYDHPFLWGSKRTGPDLAHESQIQPSADWHKTHLINPRVTSITSIMPAYPWLFQVQMDPAEVQRSMRAMQKAGVPYSESDIQEAVSDITGRSEGDAIIAFILKLGRDTAVVKPR